MAIGAAQAPTALHSAALLLELPGAPTALQHLGVAIKTQGSQSAIAYITDNS